MDNRPIEQALERAERALLRIERAVERGAMHREAPAAERDPALREKLSLILADLDDVIREASV